MRVISIYYSPDYPPFTTSARSHDEAGDHLRDYHQTLDCWRKEGVLGEEFVLTEVAEVLNPEQYWIEFEVEAEDDLDN